MGAEKRFKYEDVKRYIEERGSRMISTEYKNCDTKVTVLCTCCSDEYDVTFYNFKNKGVTTCKSCSAKNTKQCSPYTYEYIREYIESNGCELISEKYTKNTDNINIRCSCGEEFTTSYAKFRVMKTKGCRNCASKPISESRKIKYTYVKCFIEEESDSGCKLMSSECNSATEKIEILCKCGNKYTTTFTKFKDRCKRQCNMCSNRTDWNIDTVREYVNDNSKCILVSNEYSNINNKLVFKCECGNLFETTFDKFKGKRNKKQCNDCAERSKLEKKTREVLKLYNIKNVAQKTFDGCVNDKTGYKLRYDFYVKSHNLLIECDGIQHYEPVRFYEAISNDDAILNFNNQKYKDGIKDEYAKTNNIDLLRIPYWDYDRIEEILINKLKLEVE